MKLPKKITPDRIKDSIVEIRYQSSMPPEIVAGMFFEKLDESYTYTNRPMTKRLKTGNNLETVSLEIPPIIAGSPSIFYNDRIKLSLLPGSLVFNCIGDYILWENYLPEIIRALKQLAMAQAIEKVTRIGMRYITEYPNQDLHDCVKFKFTFGQPDIKSDSYAFRAEYRKDGYRTILNLKNTVPGKATENPPNSNMAVSVIDIDVIRETDLTNSRDDHFFGQVVSELDALHLKGKEAFFSLLTEGFLKKLNPEY